MRLYDLAGHLERAIPVPGLGTASGLIGRFDRPEVLYAFTAPLVPTEIFVFDAARGTSHSFEPPHLTFDPSAFETERVFYHSKDGTRVPMFITHRKDMRRDGTNPTILYAYGGFSINITPSFSPPVIAWLERGGVYATANIRGGAEYGESWHHAGMFEKKQNVFDDFIAAAQYLIEEKITSRAHLAINGGSNGGLLVGAVMTQRPDLFQVALPQVGVMDMLRYHRFSGGQAWATEYGTADDSVAFKYLYAYSPLQNIRTGVCYPATLVTTADHDDRVVPSHSFKFTATLQAAQAAITPNCARPMLIRVEVEGSHGYRPLDRAIAEEADIYAFAAATRGDGARTGRASEGEQVDARRRPRVIAASRRAVGACPALSLRSARRRSSWWAAFWVCGRCGAAQRSAAARLQMQTPAPHPCPSASACPLPTRCPFRRRPPRGLYRVRPPYRRNSTVTLTPATASDCGPVAPVISGTARFDAVSRTVQIRGRPAEREQVVVARSRATRAVARASSPMCQDPTTRCGTVVVRQLLRPATGQPATASDGSIVLASGATSLLRPIEFGMPATVTRLHVTLTALATHVFTVPGRPPDAIPPDEMQASRSPDNIVTGDAHFPGRVVRDKLWLIFRSAATAEEREAAMEAVNGIVVGGMLRSTGNRYPPPSGPRMQRYYYVRIPAYPDSGAVPLERAIQDAGAVAAGAGCGGGRPAAVTGGANRVATVGGAGRRPLPRSVAGSADRAPTAGDECVAPTGPWLISLLCLCALLLSRARAPVTDGVRFELTIPGSPVCRFSRPVPSTTRPPVRLLQDCVLMRPRGKFRMLCRALEA